VVDGTMLHHNVLTGLEGGGMDIFCRVGEIELDRQVRLMFLTEHPLSNQEVTRRLSHAAKATSISDRPGITAENRKDRTVSIS
jgi:hypothetical protein